MVCCLTRSKVKVKDTSNWKRLKRSRPSVPHGAKFFQLFPFCRCLCLLQSVLSRWLAVCRAWMLGRRQPRLLLLQSNEQRQSYGTGEQWVYDVLYVWGMVLHVLYIARNYGNSFLQTTLSERQFYWEVKNSRVFCRVPHQVWGNRCAHLHSVTFGALSSIGQMPKLKPPFSYVVDLSRWDQSKCNWNVGQCPSWWPPCRIWMAPSVQRCKVWLMPTTRVPCSNAAKMRNPLKLAGVPQTTISDASSTYYEDMWGGTLLFNKLSFFPIVDTCVSYKDIARQSRTMVPRWRFFGSFISSEPRAAHFRPAF